MLLLASSFPVAFALAVFAFLIGLVTGVDWHVMFENPLTVFKVASATMLAATLVSCVVCVTRRIATKKGVILPSLIAAGGLAATLGFLYVKHWTEHKEEVTLRKWQLFNWSRGNRCLAASRLSALGDKANAALPALVSAVARETDEDARRLMRQAIETIAGEAEPNVAPMQPPTILAVKVVPRGASGFRFVMGERFYDDGAALAVAISAATEPDDEVMVRLFMGSGVPSLDAWWAVETARGGNVVDVEAIEKTEWEGSEVVMPVDADSSPTGPGESRPPNTRVQTDAAVEASSDADRSE